MKRRLLREAVADNLDTIRGLPPRPVRPARRVVRIWIKRASLLLVPITLAGSTYLASKPEPAPPQPVQRASVMFPRIRTHGPATIDTLQAVDAAAFPLSVRRVVLDAGHGGNDPGAATTVVSEKDVTLDIGSRLRRLLERAGFEVVVTRSDDRLIPLRERARLANASESDIFVSIHVNSLQAHTNAHGIETYYLGATNDPMLTRLAAAENQVSGYSLADMRKLLDGVYVDVRRDESRRLAGAVQEQLFANLKGIDPGLENWGVKRAPFIVLVATEMPAILAEVGCISNEKEAVMLHRPEYRQQIAQALFRGIYTYSQRNKG